jgi:predicted nucleic acid-binding Zn ribbon protein
MGRWGYEQHEKKEFNIKLFIIPTLILIAGVLIA